MRKSRCFLLLLSVMFVVLLAVTFFTWLGRVKGGEEAIRDAAKNEVDKFFSFIIKRIIVGYMICHVIPLRLLL